VILSALLLLAFQCPDGSPPPCRGARSAPAPGANSVAVLYFDNLSRDTANAYLADGLTEELIARLGQVRRIDVKSRFESQRVRGGALRDARALGRAVRAAWIVSGSLQQAGQRVRLSVSLVRTTNGSQVWANVYDRSGADILQIQSDIASEVAGAITGQLLPEEQASLARRPTNDAAAYDLYLRGISASNSLSEAGLRAGLELLGRAIARDSSFADAYSQQALLWLVIADSYVDGRTGYTRVRAAAERALRIDSSQALAWAALSLAAVSLDYDSTAALRLSRRAVSIDPRQAFPHALLAMALALAGRLDDGIREARLGWRADTLSAPATLSYLMLLKSARQLDTLTAILPRMRLALAPEDIREWDGWVRFMRGDAAGAAERLTWPYFGGWFAAERVKALVALGRRGEARATLDSLLAEHARGYFNAFVIAQSYAALGNADSSFVWLDRAQEQRTHWRMFTPWDAVLEPLRADPRFAAFLRRMRPAT
jgi:TolB-like protein